MQQQPRLPLWFLVANWALIAAAFALGALLGSRRDTPADYLATLPKEQLEALAVVHSTIMKSHVEPQNDRTLLENAIKGMVRSLDPYSLYVPPADVKRYEEDNTGHYEGIGAHFEVHAGRVVLHYPLADSPAERAGLRPGDVLLAVDGAAIARDATHAQIVELVRGPSDTDVTLRVERDGKPFDVKVRRGDVVSPCVKWVRLLDEGERLGYVHLTDFHPGCKQQLLDAIASLQTTAPLRGLIFDLRGDTGGNLDECIGIARAFLREGVIVSQVRRDGEIVERHEARSELCRHPDLPLVLLVNEKSASASEVLAGALQDHGRAAIVGQRTFGKGYVNTVYTWKHLPFRLKLTTGHYHTPNGRDIERHHHAANPDDKDAGGIAPDVAVAVDERLFATIALALADREPPPAWRDAFAEVARRYSLPIPGPLAAADDPQLAAALRTLRERIAAPRTDTSASNKEKDK